MSEEEGREGREREKEGGMRGGRQEKREKERGRKKGWEEVHVHIGRKGGAYIPKSTYNLVSFVSSSTMADASSSKNCIHTARRLLA